MRSQTRFIIEQIARTLNCVGAGLADVTFNTVILKDLSDYAEFNEVYREFFSSEPPARYCIEAKLVKDDLLVEIAATAYVPINK